MLSDLSKAVAQLSDPALRRVVVIGVLGSAIVFIALSAATWWVFATQVDLTTLDLWTWLEELLGILAGVLVATTLLVVSGILFPAVATVIVGFFLEDVVAAVEARHYPHEPPARPQPLTEVASSTIRFALAVIGINLLCLPLYLVLMFVPPLNVVLYYMVNGHLVSREFFELVALRRLAPNAATQMRQMSRGRLLAAGILLTFLLTIPIVNFLTPVVATAFMVHVFHRLPGRQEVMPK